MSTYRLNIYSSFPLPFSRSPGWDSSNAFSSINFVYSTNLARKQSLRHSEQNRQCLSNKKRAVRDCRKKQCSLSNDNSTMLIKLHDNFQLLATIIVIMLPRVY